MQNNRREQALAQALAAEDAQTERELQQQRSMREGQDSGDFD